MAAAVFTLLLFILAALIRLYCQNSWLSSLFAESVEISTPLNSWKRVLEGTFLHKHGIDPWSGNVFHETPIALVAYKYLMQQLDSYLPFLFVGCDLVTAFFLSRCGHHYGQHQLRLQKEEKKSFAADAFKLLISEETISHIPRAIAVVYLFNPYIIMSCVAQTTTVFQNTILAMVLYFTVIGWWPVSISLLSLAAHHSLYPLMLIVPVLMYHVQLSRLIKSASPTMVKCYVMMLLFWFLLCVSGLVYLSREIAGQFQYIYNTYLFILTVPDLTPNIGIFWYFFTEIFDHFRQLFICTFQINAFIYTFPLALRLRKEPMLLFFSLCSIMTIFKSYPSIGDVGFYLALLPLWSHLYPHIRQGFLVGGIILACSVLSPLLWYLWIYAGSANANFFFAVTLAFATAQIFLITDILFAHIKRDFHLRNGMKLEINGKPARLKLK